MADDDFIVDLEALDTAFNQFVPHNHALGLRVIDATTEPAAVVIRLPYDDRWVGHPETGVLHGGVVTTLLDATSGACVYMKLKKPTPIATLDLRIDYLKPSLAKRDLFARAECFKATRNVAFVRAVAYHEGPGDPIATATATFMLSTKGKSVHERAGL